MRYFVPRAATAGAGAANRGDSGAGPVQPQSPVRTGLAGRAEPVAAAVGRVVLHQPQYKVRALRQAPRGAHPCLSRPPTSRQP